MTRLTVYDVGMGQYMLTVRPGSVYTTSSQSTDHSKALILPTARRDISWNGDLGWVSISPVGDIDLCAGDVELRSPRNVQANLLYAGEVLERLS